MNVLAYAVVAASVLPATRASAQPAAAPPATLIYSNRPIIEFRASVLDRSPAERAAAAKAQIDTVVTSGAAARVSSRVVEGVTIVAAGGQNLFVIMHGDVDALRGETLEQKASAAAARLQTAIDEEIELRTPARLAMAAVQALGATVVFAVLLVFIWRGHRKLVDRVPADIEQKLEKISAGDRQLVRATKAGEMFRRLIVSVTAALSLVLSYFWLTFVLRRFPYTRPWGESLREFLVARLAAIGVAVIESIPDLFTVAVVVVVTRFVSRFLHAFFEAVEQNRLQIPLIYPETAQPTRRIATALLWLFALAVSYPYLPGSESEAFKGISVFVGLIVSLGSSGIVGQMMSGLTITYSRAVRLGDYVRIGDIEGTVTHLGSLSTKVKTERREDVTIPNSVVVSTPMTNYSRFADVEGVMTPTSVTVGYNVPWRQIHAMLLLAAERTPGIRKSPAPAVRQSQFENNCVEYTLLTCLEDPNRRHAMLGVLRSNILDVFNEFGVQIMTPSYEGDPDAPKIVPPEQWYAAPAVPPARGDSPDTAVKTSVP